MINVLKIIFTLLMLASIYVVINKKLQIPISFLIIGFAGMIVGGLINGTLPLTNGSTGYLFFDLFEYFKQEGILENLKTVGMNMFAITGYVYYMNYLKASELFALIIVKPLRRIKNKYILAGASYLLTTLLILVIPNGMGRLALLFGITYPVMMACGVSKATAATSILAATGLSWGPANPQVLNAYALSGLDSSNLDLVSHFATYESPWNFIAIVLSAAMFVTVSIVFDKKDGYTVEDTSNIELKDPKSLGIPMWWALFPVLPLVMILLFSSLVPATPNLGIPCVEYMCFTIVVVLVCLSSKDKVAAFNGGNQLFVSFGNNVANVISVVFAGSVFGKGIQMIGGFNLVLKPFLETDAPNIPLFIIVVGLVGAIIGFAGGSNFVPISVLGGAVKTLITTFGLNEHPFIIMMTGCYMPVMGMSPSTSFMAYSINESGLDVGTMLKRCIPTQLITITVFIIGAIMQLG